MRVRFGVVSCGRGRGGVNPDVVCYRVAGRDTSDKAQNPLICARAEEHLHARANVDHSGDLVLLRLRHPDRDPGAAAC